MELFYASLFSISIFFAIFLAIFQHFFKKTSISGTLPPGQTGWPVIGETFDFLSTGWKGHPEKFVLDRMTKYSPVVFQTHVLGERAAFFCGPNGNKFLFTNENKLVQAWWPKSVEKIFQASFQTNTTREEAIKLRKLLPNFLKAEALQRYVGLMDRLAQRHFADEWEGKEEVFVHPLAKKYTFWLACKLFLSVEDPGYMSKLVALFSVVNPGFLSVPIDLPGTPFHKAIKASNLIKKELLSNVRRRKIELAEGTASPTQDVLSHMLLKCDETGRFMHELDVADKIFGLLIGGYDTTTSACSSVVKFLAELPEIYQKVYNEQMEIGVSKSEGELLNWDDIRKMKYSWNVVCETLRLAPPISGTFREAVTDFVYKGFTIPKGWKLFWNVNSTHKNPEVFPQPEKFDPSRFEGSGPAPYAYVPFGGGPKMCPGSEYARFVILVFLHHLVKRFKWEKIIPNEKLVLDPLPFPAKGLPVRLYPHKT